MRDLMSRVGLTRYLEIEFQFSLDETKERLKSIVDEEIMFDTNVENKKKNLSGNVHDVGLEFSNKSRFFQSALAHINLVRASGTFLDQGSSVLIKMRIEPRIRFYLLIFISALTAIASLVVLFTVPNDTSRFGPFIMAIIGATIIVLQISFLRDGLSEMERLIDIEFKNIKRIPHSSLGI